MQKSLQHHESSAGSRLYNIVESIALGICGHNSIYGMSAEFIVTSERSCWTHVILRDTSTRHNTHGMYVLHVVSRPFINKFMSWLISPFAEKVSNPTNDTRREWRVRPSRTKKVKTTLRVMIFKILSSTWFVATYPTGNCLPRVQCTTRYHASIRSGPLNA